MVPSRFHFGCETRNSTRPVASSRGLGLTQEARAHCSLTSVRSTQPAMRPCVARPQTHATTCEAAGGLRIVHVAPPIRARGEGGLGLVVDPGCRPPLGLRHCILGQRRRRSRMMAAVGAVSQVLHSVLGLSQLVVLAAARLPPWPTQFSNFPRKDALDARLPPPAYRHARSGDLYVCGRTKTTIPITKKRLQRLNPH